jgi:hypothetical protein
VNDRRLGDALRKLLDERDSVRFGHLLALQLRNYVFNEIDHVASLNGLRRVPRNLYVQRRCENFFDGDISGESNITLLLSLKRRRPWMASG